MHATLNHRTEAPPTDPPRTAALTAGIALLLMAALAFFAEFYVRARVIDSHDLTVTLNHLRASGSLFRAGNAANLIVAALDILVAGLPQSRATLGSSSGTYGGRLEEPRFHRQTLLA